MAQYYYGQGIYGTTPKSSTSGGISGTTKYSATGMTNQMADIATKPPEYYVGQAAVDTRLAYDESLGAMQRDLSRMGINPNSGRYGGIYADWALAESAAEAGAKTRARQQAEAKSFEQMGQVANLYAGPIASNQYRSQELTAQTEAEKARLAAYEEGTKEPQPSGFTFSTSTRGGGGSTSAGTTGGITRLEPASPQPVAPANWSSPAPAPAPAPTPAGGIGGGSSGTMQTWSTPANVVNVPGVSAPAPEPANIMRATFPSGEILGAEWTPFTYSGERPVASVESAASSVGL